MKNIIETFDLTKIYQLKGQNKEIKALDNINISIKEGEIFGLLGPNGAGKTTLIYILTTLAQPTRGYAIIDGYNILKKPKKAKSKIALMLDNKLLYYRVTAYDNLKFYCKLYKVPNYKEKINEIVEVFGLEKWLNQYVEHFSRGMKVKLAFCRTLLLNRKILFLDEPTLGLDVQTVSFIVKKIKELDKTIFLTSHNMNVVEKTCDRFAFIHEGQILKIGTKKGILDLLKTEIKITIRIKDNKNDLRIELAQKDFVIDVFNDKEDLVVSIKERRYFRDLLNILSNYPILSVKEHEDSLEDIFLKIMK